MAHRLLIALCVCTVVGNSEENSEAARGETGFKAVAGMSVGHTKLAAMAAWGIPLRKPSRTR